MPEPAAAQTVGRYVLYEEIASGGMASVHMGRLTGPAGFSRIVAVKRSHAAYAKDPGFVAMMLDEARLASRVRHANVVPILDVVASDDELLLVMEYIHGETLARLLRAQKKSGQTLPPNIAVAIVIDVLRGLHAAHEARGVRGEPLGIVHRDVSPQNILVATDGSARLFDFGVAKAVSRSQSTDDGQLKGKIGYIAPEQLSGRDVDRRVDIFAASTVAWECIAGKRLFSGDDVVGTLAQIVDAEIPSLRKSGIYVPEALDKAILRGLERDPKARHQSAEDMARELEAALRPASRERVSAWVESLAGGMLARRLESMRRIETGEADSGVVQVPVQISPDQSGKLATLRASVGAPEPQPSEDPSTSAALATQSIVPAPAGTKSRRGALWVLLAAVIVAAIVFVAWRKRQPTLASAPPPPVLAAQPSATAEQPKPAPSATAAPAPAPSATAAPPASVEAPDAGAAAPKSLSAARPAARPRPKPSAEPAKPATLPVDPLQDQR